MTTAHAFFVAQGNNRFHATEHTRGPWSEDHQHAGPPSALLARAVERFLPATPRMQVTRMSLDIIRPIPIGALGVEVSADHDGRSVKTLDALLRDAQGTLLMRARVLAIRVAELPIPQVASPHAVEPLPDESTPFQPPFFAWETGYHKAIEWRIASGEFGSGTVTAWMRMRMPLVAAEVPTPLQRVMTIADSGSGVSQALDTRRFTFVNPDLGVYLHRPLVGEWLCLQSHTQPQSSGIALADTCLLDTTGPIGRAVQSLIIRDRA